MSFFLYFAIRKKIITLFIHKVRYFQHLITPSKKAKISFLIKVTTSSSLPFFNESTEVYTLFCTKIKATTYVFFGDILPKNTSIFSKNLNLHS